MYIVFYYHTELTLYLDVSLYCIFLLKENGKQKFISPCMVVMKSYIKYDILITFLPVLATTDLTKKGKFRWSKNFPPHNFSTHRLLPHKAENTHQRFVGQPWYIFHRRVYYTPHPQQDQESQLLWRRRYNFQAVHPWRPSIPSPDNLQKKQPSIHYCWFQERKWYSGSHALYSQYWSTLKSIFWETLLDEPLKRRPENIVK